MAIREELEYSIIDSGHLFLMHRILCASDVCVGEAFELPDATWEVRVASTYKGTSGQIMVGIYSSRGEALEVLWDQRLLMHWGYLQ